MPFSFVFRAFLPVFHERHGRSGGNVFSAAVAAVTWEEALEVFNDMARHGWEINYLLFGFCVIVYGSYHGNSPFFNHQKSNLSDGRKETKESLYKCQISWCVLNVHVLRRDPRCDLRLQSREFNAAMFTASEGGGGIYGRWDNKFLHFLSLKGLLCLLQSRWCFFFN